MKKKILFILTLFLILVACGENGSIEDLCSNYQGEVFVYMGGGNLSDIYEKYLSGLSFYEFIYLDEQIDLYKIASFVKKKNGE